MESDFQKLSISSGESSKKIGWFDLPDKIRSEIIEMMDTYSKCCFSMCSKTCCKEVEMSKRYIDSIKVTDNDDTKIEVSIQEGDFTLEFFESSEGNEIWYRTCGEELKWESKFEGETIDIVFKYFEKFVKNSNHLEELLIDFTDFPFDKINIKHLRNLDSIKIMNGGEGEVDLIECGFLDADQLYSIRHLVKLDCAKLYIGQISNLSASKISLSAINISSTDLNQFLKTWRDGQINENIESMEFRAVERFRGRQVFGDLDIIGHHKRDDGNWFKLKNSKEHTAEIHLHGKYFAMNCKTPSDNFLHESFGSTDSIYYDSENEEFYRGPSRKNEEEWRWWEHGFVSCDDLEEAFYDTD